MAGSPSAARDRKRRHHRLLYRLEADLEPVMFVLALAWLWLFIIELVSGLAPWQERAGLAIWAAFIFEFLLKLRLSPNHARYLVQNWITAIALVVPALRVFRLLRALRLLRATRVASTTRFVRALTSSRRFYRDVREAQGAKPAPEMNVGLLVISRDPDATGKLQSLALRMAGLSRRELESATGLAWNFHVTRPRRLETDASRLPADFLEEASMAMAEGPHDAVIVITDVMLVSREKKMQAGLASATARIAVISTRRLIAEQRGKPTRELDSPEVEANAATLMMHLLGHISGLRHDARSPVMRPFAFRITRRGAPRFTPAERDALARIADRLPERELHGGTMLGSLLFHVLMALRHPAQLLLPLWRNRAPLLPLSLPGLATAAVAPSFLLVFTAEIWDVGLGMSNATVATYASLSILGASLFLARVQSLFLPRRERNVLTEHLAVANAVIFLSIVFACIGLFLIVAGLMLIIEVWIFPADLMQTWPTLDQPEVGFAAKVRLSAFIATIGVSTGALAGGFESRKVIRNLALFADET